MSRLQSFGALAIVPRNTKGSVNGRIEERINRSPRWAFAWLSLAYFIVVASMSSLKLLWLDELITLHIARLGGLHAIWHALALGADPNPPVTHLLVHFSRRLFGDHEFAYRLPAALGYWVGLLSLFQYLRSRVPAAWALGGALLSMSMAAFDYSYESRSYGIFYGLAMLAFFCWTRAVDFSSEAQSRWLALAGLAVALAAGISTNYFAVLAFIPVAAGEAVRTFSAVRNNLRASRRLGLASAFQLRIWIAMAISATPVLVYLPLIRHSIAQFAPYAWNKVSLGQVSDSYTEMVEIVLYPILALFVFGICVHLAARWIEVMCPYCKSRLIPSWLQPLLGRRPQKLRVPGYEMAGIFCLMAYPFLGYIIASIRGGMLSPRFVIPVCFGFAIAGTLVAFQIFRCVPRAGLVFICFMSAWFVCRESYMGYWYEEQKQCLYKVLDHLPEAESELPPNAPIVIPDPLLVLAFQHYAPRPVADRVVFPMDFPAIRRFQGDDSPEENLWAGRNSLYTLPIKPLATYQRRAQEYLIIAGDGNWLLEDLRLHNYPLDRLPINTRAASLGGFTPLAHGTPVFYLAYGDPGLAQFPTLDPRPIPFRVSDNLPDARPGATAGADPTLGAGQ